MIYLTLASTFLMSLILDMLSNNWSHLQRANDTKEIVCRKKVYNTTVNDFSAKKSTHCKWVTKTAELHSSHHKNTVFA